MDETLKQLQSEAIEILLEWYKKHPEVNTKLPSFTIKWNGRLRRTAGKIYYRDRRIELSSQYYVQFGYQRVSSTLRHELAHYLAYFVYGKKKHCDVFKKLCAELKGTMNREQAGSEYSDCATDEWIPHKSYLIYQCQCGQKYKRLKSISKKMLNRYKCAICKKYLSTFTVTQVNTTIETALHKEVSFD